MRRMKGVAEQRKNINQMGTKEDQNSHEGRDNPCPGSKHERGEEISFGKGQAGQVQLYKSSQAKAVFGHQQH